MWLRPHSRIHPAIRVDASPALDQFQSDEIPSSSRDSVCPMSSTRAQYQIDALQ